MEILKAKETDIDDIERIYEHIHDEEENGRAVIGWIRNVYPVRKTAEDALRRNDLFVMKEENEVVQQRSSIRSRLRNINMPGGEWKQRTVKLWCCIVWL